MALISTSFLELPMRIYEHRGLSMCFGGNLLGCFGPLRCRGGDFGAGWPHGWFKEGAMRPHRGGEEGVRRGREPSILVRGPKKNYLRWAMRQEYKQMQRIIR